MPSLALRQFVLFGVVGTAGFIVDASVLLALTATTLVGPLSGRVVSYLCAATCTWALNRVITFPDRAGRASGAQWARFVGANLVGALANFGIYTWLILEYPLLPGQPVIAVAAGSLGGLALNFTLSRTLVFHHAQQ
jgi:putative flippase GtrA